MKIAGEFAGSRILVTGAAGFIGGNLAAALANVACELTLVDRNPVDVPEGLARIDMRTMDVGSPEFCALAVDGFDYLFHLAGNATVGGSVTDPVLDFDQNCTVTLRILEAMRAAESRTQLIYASSAAVYGSPVRLPIREDDPTVPISPYGVSKLAAERYLAVYCSLYGLSGVSLRMFSPFGPGLRKQVVFDLTRRILSGPGPLRVFGDGQQARDFFYADDLISAILHVAARGQRDGGAYNIGCGASTSTGAIAEALVRIARPGMAIEYDHRPVAGNPDVWSADIARLEGLGWRAEVPLEEGLARTVEWIARAYP